jgi:glycolate oxidase
LKEKIIQELKSIVGAENLYTSLEERVCYSYDATNQRYLPEAVARPISAQEISAILKLANREHIPLVPRGAGSGFTGGSLPVEGGIALVLTRMKRILEIDRENLTALVEPGVVTGDLQRTVEAWGLFYPPDPNSLNFCTLGGNVAENAGGPRAVKYGVTKDYVLGLEVVLPTGEIIHTGARTVKSVVGYDLTRLMVGSEGTLGVVTQILLRLIPKPEAVLTMRAFFPTVQQAARAITQIIACKIVPSTLEFMDRSALRCVEEGLGLGLPLDAEALLLIEVDGEGESLPKQAEKIKELCRQEGAQEFNLARNTQEREDLWKARRNISPSLARLGPTKVNEDITVPRSKLPEILSAIREIAGRYQLTIVTYGHAGDGNLHVNIMTDKNKIEEMKRVGRAVEELFAATLALGGTISGEHGIGISKAPYLSMELSTQTINVMRKIKEVLDPNNILNPGKIFYSPKAGVATHV